MANFLKTKAKLITILYLVVIALVFLYALTFMTNYAHIHVYVYQGKPTFNAVLTINQQSNSSLFTYFQKIDSSNPLFSQLNGVKGQSAFVNSGLADKVMNFTDDMNKFNDLLIVYGCVCVVLLACMMIASNHSRKIYYKSNLIVGIAAPAVVAGFSIYMLISLFDLLSTFNKNEKLFRAVSYLQDGNYTIKEKNAAIKNWDTVMDNTKDVNNLTFILGIILFVVIIIYSVFMIVYTFYRYKECSKRRAEIIERAAKAND